MTSYDTNVHVHQLFDHWEVCLCCNFRKTFRYFLNISGTFISKMFKLTGQYFI